MTVLAYDDVWLREPRLLVPNRVPVGPVRIDYRNPIASKLVHAWLTGRQIVADISGRGAHASSTIATCIPVGSDIGLVRTFLSPGEIVTPKRYNFDGATEISAVVHYRANSVANGNSTYTNQALINNGHTGPFDFFAGTYASFFPSLFINGDERATTSENVPAASAFYWDKWIVGVAVYNSVIAEIRISIVPGGRKYGAYTTALNSTTNGWSIGNKADATNRPFLGEIASAFVFARALSVAEQLSIMKDPYQFLIPA